MIGSIKNQLNFLQNNAHRSNDASSVLRRTLIENEIDILFIQEPQVNKLGSICGLPNGILFFKPGILEEDRPRSGLWLESRFKDSILLNQFLSRDVVAVKISTLVGNNHVNIVICWHILILVINLSPMS